MRTARDRDSESQHEGAESVAVGKRPLTSSLVQRRAAAPAAGPAYQPASQGAFDDPFGFGAFGAVQARGGQVSGDGPSVVATAEQGVAGASSALPFADTIQRSFGRHDVGGIRAQVGGAGAEAAQAIGATAYATGDRVAFAGAPDLHTAAHEAAHVVQQRAGVHLKGGVGEVGDTYERHADAVADLVVQGKSAEALLDQHAGSSGGGVQRAVQRASAYDNILPGHDTFGDSYSFKGGRNKEFTYHHIIPENKLVEVTTELKAIKAYLETDEPSNEVRSKGETLNEEVDVLVNGAKRMWQQTRITDTTYKINRTFDTLGVKVTEDEVRNLIVNKPENLDDLFPAFEALLKGKVQAVHNKATLSLKRTIVEALKDEAFYTYVSNDNVTAIADYLAPDLDRIVFDRTYLERQIRAALVEVRQGKPKHTPVNKGAFASTLEGKLRERDFTAFYRTECLNIHEDATTEGRLKRLLQLSALPKDESSHLEHAVQWNPGNIHRGPSSSKRLNPKDRGFIAKLDDGGNTFEQAAFNVVSPEHFKKLNELNKEIDKLLLVKTTPEHPPTEEKLEQATKVVGLMQGVFELGLTGFKESQWEQHGDDKMRLVLDEERESKAKENKLIK